MYPSTFSHLNASSDLPTDHVQPVQTVATGERKPRRRGSPRRRRRLALGLARLAPGGSPSP